MGPTFGFLKFSKPHNAAEGACSVLAFAAMSLVWISPDHTVFFLLLIPEYVLFFCSYAVY